MDEKQFVGPAETVDSQIPTYEHVVVPQTPSPFSLFHIFAGFIAGLVLLIGIASLFFFMQNRSISTQYAATNLGTCSGANNQSGFCTTTAPSGNYVAFYQDKVPGSQCGINATKDNAARNTVVYCCKSGTAQYGTCDTGGQHVCNTTCSGSNISYQDKAAGSQCAINATKANLPRNTVVYCMCDKTKQSCPTPTVSPTQTPLEGDVNHDGKVDVVDYSLLIACFGDKFGTDSCVAGKAADINGDGAVDGIDYNIWFRVFLGIEK